MIQNTSFAYYPCMPKVNFAKSNKKNKQNVTNSLANSTSVAKNAAFYTVGPIRTTLNEVEKQKYTTILNVTNGVVSDLSMGLKPSQQLDVLLKNGKLLSKSLHDNSTVLDNLYNIATLPRAKGLNSTGLILDVLDTISNPRIITQTFGDIPQNIQPQVVHSLSKDNPVKSNPSTMNVEASGTCAAGSIEVNMADKYPAEFARWVSELSSENKSVMLHVKLNSLNKSPLEAITFINLLEAQKQSINFIDGAKIKADLDEGAYIRAQIQTTCRDKNERCVADVLVQSAIMKLGTQNTYNSLNDLHLSKFNPNPQGLTEVEKTFVESLVKNKEITSLTYQNIDDNQNLVGYFCSFDKIQKHITDTIDSGDDVILGYIETNQTAGLTSLPNYNPAKDGPANKVINGHEITVVDYYKDEKGEVVFVCVDTDDNNTDFVQYSAKSLLPKVHHAGYPAELVKADADEIIKQYIQQ